MTKYNEIDPYAAMWLRSLALAGHIPKGEVDERSITDLVSNLSIQVQLTSGAKPTGSNECSDGKHRPVEPGTFPLADGTPATVEQLRAYGNACVGPLAAEFLRCFRDSLIELGAGA